jgi:hypothetical protein
VLNRQPSPTSRLPWISLALLLLTYATFGWLLYDWTRNREVWLLVGLGSAILAGFVTYPSRTVSMSFGGFFRADARALILIILGSIVSVILLTWLQIFVDVVVLCAAGLLVSLDLKTRGWSKPLTLLMIIGWQLLSLSLGLCLHYFNSHPLTNLPPYFYSAYWLQLLDR